MLLIVLSPTSKAEIKLVGIKAPNDDCDIKRDVSVWI